FQVVLHSQIPIARGMGSGAAVAAAIVRALALYFEQPLPSRTVSELVYQTEIIFHGTPSGIDNTVVAFEKPVYFIKGEKAEIFWVGSPLYLLIADTGIPSQTRDMVAQIRRKWRAHPQRYQALFDEIASLVQEGREAIVKGDVTRLGELMNQNHALLQDMGVSCPELDQLVQAAREAGALGAKLSGGGGGGCMIALVNSQLRDQVSTALLLANAQQVLFTTIR
ncbi:MAG: mevalonate kinase, partial [Anaerolineae bacterium]|nr:mevalonate kinase [Anaerolineae bacterium]